MARAGADTARGGETARGASMAATAAEPNLRVAAESAMAKVREENSGIKKNHTQNSKIMGQSQTGRGA